MKGSILIEAILSLAFVLLPVMAINFEMVRLCQYSCLLHHMAFLYVRNCGLGMSSENARRRALEVANESLGKADAVRFQKRIRWEIGLTSRRGDELSSRLIYRYPSWFSALRGRIQVSKVCRFFF